MTVRSLLALTALSSAFMAAVPAQAAPYTWTGVVRDFCAVTDCVVGGTTYTAHPDFERTIADDRGMVSTTLGLDGKPVYLPAGASSGNTVTSPTTFNQFFNTTAGVNMAGTYGILMEDPDNNGIFTYTNNSFFPIDNQLLGNQGRGHNYHFTYELAGVFGYKAGTGQVFNFTGDDDVWVFINNKLAIDLGGVHGAQNANVNLDTIAASFGLLDNQNYNISVFFAERHTTQSSFRIDTSLEIRGTTEIPEPSTYAMMLAGLGMLGFMARRRMKA